MIVRPRPGPLGLLFTLRGSVVPQIAGRIAAVAAVSTLVTTVHHLRPTLFPELPATPFTLLGLGLSIFLGFRNSACYDRWWEARKQWGQLVTEARCLSRRLQSLFPDPARHDGPIREIVAFALALAARLRGPETGNNRPDAILRALTAGLADRLERGEMTDMTFHALEAHVVALCSIQTACERIRSTPTPFAYTLLLHRTAWLFCLLVPFTLVGTVGLAAPLVAAILAYAFFGLDALGDELEEPFALRPNTVPMDALARIVEIELRASLGDTGLSSPLRPVDHILR